MERAFTTAVMTNDNRCFIMHGYDSDGASDSITYSNVLNKISTPHPTAETTSGPVAVLTTETVQTQLWYDTTSKDDANSLNILIVLRVFIGFFVCFCGCA